MFFSGDPALRRKVELRGRSSKESDRQGTLNRVKDEREQRQRARQRQQSAIRIQKCFRGRRDVARNQVLVREEFFAAFGEFSDRAPRNVFRADSKYLPHIFYIISPTNSADFYRLAGACRHFLRCLGETEGGTLSVFVSGEYNAQRGAVNYRVKHFASLCLRSLHHHRESLKKELSLPEDGSRDDIVSVFVGTILSLARAELPWAGSLIEYLAVNKMFSLLRDLVLTLQDTDARSVVMLSLERLVHQLSVLYIGKADCLQPMPFTWSLPAQIFSVPLLWQRLPRLKEVSVTAGVWAFVVHQTAINKLELRTSLPSDVSPQFPSFVCLLGNLLESSRLAVQQPNSSIQLVTDIANVARTLLSTPPITYALCPRESSDAGEDDDMRIENEESFVLEPALTAQLQHASDFEFLKAMVRVAFSQPPFDLNTVATPFAGAPEASAVSAVCGFLYAAFSVLDKSTIIPRLAYVANLVPPLWQYISSCRLNHNWPAIELPSQDVQLTPELLGWMLPLAVFCPVFSHLLFSMDNDEFYNMKQPISIEDVLQLVLILKEGLWQLLWVMPFKPSSFVASDVFVFQNMRQCFINVSSSLLAELHDRNSKRQFAPSHTFHAREAIEESFFHQAEGENTKAREVLNKAPFLIPFALRVRVYTAQRTASRQNTSHHYTGVQIKVQRDRIIEDAFTNLNVLSEESLRGTIRVSYINELGVEEAGVDGGGIFKDFMENLTKTGFDIQYGLFKETVDHLLYPNPASHMVNDEDLQYYEFFGKILGKAMFEGILVDIPFATFFLRKLRKKYNYLHDLPSLDPELYKNLLFLKNNPNVVQQLGLYFVIEDNEYGEQLEVELLPGGKDIQVTKENVYRYIHLVANHRLNHQIRQQSNHFLRGFQQLISPEWIDMFNEHELQILISGSQDGMDVDDLHHNVNYGGGYHENHPVIQMFWDTLKSLDTNMQRKFLKFVTGCSRGPFLGFKYLEPHFCIQKTAPEDAAEEALDRLPTSATCMNLLKLPPYKSKHTIREKLLYAITADAGFDLS